MTVRWLTSSFEDDVATEMTKTSDPSLSLLIGHVTIFSGGHKF